MQDKRTAKALPWLVATGIALVLLFASANLLRSLSDRSEKRHETQRIDVYSGVRIDVCNPSDRVCEHWELVKKLEKQN